MSNPDEPGQLLKLFDEPVQRVDLAGADAKTLRLSVPLLNAERLEQVIRFQRHLVATLKASPTHDEAAVARAHQEAVAHSGLSPRDASELEALARVFAGHLWTLRKLEARYQEAQAQVTAAEARGEKPAPQELQALSILPKEIAAKASREGLERRYGAGVVTLLRSRAEELLALHEELANLQRS